MQRELFTAEHEAFRETVRTFLAKEVIPHHERWEQAGIVDREAWLAAGRQGLLGLAVPEEYGGGGTTDFRYAVVMAEEFTRAGASGLALGLHNDIIGPYLTSLATEEQKRRWLPGFCSGETVTAIAMTEPGAGSDLQGIRTNAVDRGDHWLLNGAKTFISNGILADLVIVVARTTPEGGARGLSLLVVERGMEGFERGRNLDKIGQKAQDTAELFFSDVRAPKENLLGGENQGFVHLMTNLAQERLQIAVSAIAAAEHLVEITTEYVKQREAFGRPLARLQHTETNGFDQRIRDLFGQALATLERQFPGWVNRHHVSLLSVRREAGPSTPRLWMLIRAPSISRKTSSAKPSGSRNCASRNSFTRRRRWPFLNSSMTAWAG